MPRDPIKQSLYYKRWREKNLERARERSRQWDLQNRERKRANQARWRQLNPERVQELKLRSRAEADPERVRELQRKARARAKARLESLDLRLVEIDSVARFSS